MCLDRKQPGENEKLSSIQTGKKAFSLFKSDGGVCENIEYALRLLKGVGKDNAEWITIHVCDSSSRQQM